MSWWWWRWWCTQHSVRKQDPRQQTSYSAPGIALFFPSSFLFLFFSFSFLFLFFSLSSLFSFSLSYRFVLRIQNLAHTLWFRRSPWTLYLNWVSESGKENNGRETSIQNFLWVHWDWRQYGNNVKDNFLSCNYFLSKPLRKKPCSCGHCLFVCTHYSCNLKVHFLKLFPFCKRCFGSISAFGFSFWRRLSWRVCRCHLFGDQHTSYSHHKTLAYSVISYFISFL